MFTWPSIVDVMEDVLIVNDPVPLLRTKINQPEERLATAGRTQVPAPPVHTKQFPRDASSIVGGEVYWLVTKADSNLPNTAVVLLPANVAASA
jgi:hypothetical protein